MINRTLDEGYIILTHKDLARIIQEALRARINEELDKRECDNSIYRVFKEDVNRIQNTVLMHKKNRGRTNWKTRYKQITTLYERYTCSDTKRRKCAAHRSFCTCILFKLVKTGCK